MRLRFCIQFSLLLCPYFSTAQSYTSIRLCLGSGEMKGVSSVRLIDIFVGILWATSKQTFSMAHSQDEHRFSS